MFDVNYFKTLASNYLKSRKKQVKLDTHLQQIYDAHDFYTATMQLKEFNLYEEDPLLASGMSCYFNEQIDQGGFSNLHLAEQDIEDARFIAECFGKTTNYSDNGLSILYTTLLGSTELNYGMQTFPAGIFEDVFQCSPNHSFPIRPKVGESEADFYSRILEFQIDKHPEFPQEKRAEALLRAKRLTLRFCNGKNRVYVIPFSSIVHNKASFGDVAGFRDGKLNGDELNKKLESLATFESLLKTFDISIEKGIYKDPNMRSEYGIAIYGTIPTERAGYFEVERIYDLMQRIARAKGLEESSEIPANMDLREGEIPVVDMDEDDVGFSM